MIELLTDYGLFLAKSVTVLMVVLVVIMAAANVASRQHRRAESGHLQVRRLNEHVDGMRDTLRRKLLDTKAYRKLAKAEAKARKKQVAQAADRRRVWVLRFDGDLRASAVSALREEITAILTLARDGDEVVLCLESPGGMVHGYGLAASQLQRIRDRAGVKLTVAVDKVAASGGYMMACLGERILAAPFALVGSIGVVAQVPNVHRLLKRNDIDMEVLTAGEYKRTLTVFGENTPEGRAKFVEELEDIHALFKEFVADARPNLDIARVATGEAWYGKRAIELGLVDELMTSDEYVVRACEDAEVHQVSWVEQRSTVDRLLHQGTSSLAAALERIWLRWRDRNTWTG